mmetsp:Transcript_19918/g.27651  ORF Transcript_19918/g.27651 Transcript_19918/m.27651 type:complete len:520 (-) Transcript_19918:174-1733(-)
MHRDYAAGVRTSTEKTDGWNAPYANHGAKYSPSRSRYQSSSSRPNSSGGSVGGTRSSPSNTYNPGHYAQSSSPTSRPSTQMSYGGGSISKARLGERMDQLQAELNSLRVEHQIQQQLPHQRSPTYVNSVSRETPGYRGGNVPSTSSGTPTAATSYGNPPSPAKYLANQWVAPQSTQNSPKQRVSAADGPNNGSFQQRSPSAYMSPSPSQHQPRQNLSPSQPDGAADGRAAKWATPRSYTTPDSKSGRTQACSDHRKKVLKIEMKDPLDLRQTLLDNFKKAIVSRGGSHSIGALGRLFRIMDDDGNRKLDVNELKTGLADCGVVMAKSCCALLIDAINGEPGIGFVRYDDFLYAIRGELNEKRKEFVLMAFDRMDKTGDGKIDFEDLKSRYNVKHHPEVQNGKQTEREALAKWLAVFEGHEKDGVVTKEEFLDYYAHVSASIDDDRYFELMIRNAWHISGGKGECANTSNTRVLVDFKDGTQKVIALEDDLGVDLRDYRRLKFLLFKQGITQIARIRAYH